MAVTTISTHRDFTGGPLSLEATSDEWMLLTIVAHSAGLVIASRDVKNVEDAMPVPVDTPLEILLAPGSTLIAGAPETRTAFSVIRQPLPFIARAALTLQRLLGSRRAA